MAIKRKMSSGWVFEDKDMYNNYNVYEDSNAFKINAQSIKNSITSYPIGNHEAPVVVIDDFLETPSLAHNLAQQTVYSNDASKMHASPGVRSILKVNWNIDRVVKNWFQNWYQGVLDIEYQWPSPSTTFTVIDTSEPLSPPQCFPHIDVAYSNGQGLGKPNTQLVAVLIYLNKDCKGGTGIYKHKKLGKHLITNEDDFNQYSKFQEEHEKNNPDIDSNINDSENELFELVHMVDMKYNRMVMYPTCLFHHPIYSKDDFKTPNCRVVLGSFV